jgi:hypothetical protein
MLSSTGAANSVVDPNFLKTQGARSADIREIKISIAAPYLNPKKIPL